MGTEPAPTASKLSAWSPSKLARPADLLLSRCTIQKSSSLCHLVSRSPRDPSSRPTDPTHISFKNFCCWFLFWSKQKRKIKLPSCGIEKKKKKKKKNPPLWVLKKKKKKKKKK